jgi:glyoxylase-like metal-dependent hydrolase (beta-lactamase superfamily II)
MTKLPVSDHFHLEQLAEGVYAVIASDLGGSYSNAGIVDLGGATLIFDTLAAPQAAQDLRAAAEALTDRPARWVVNSHFHSDHWLGNQVFADTTIIATHRARQAMPEGSAYVRELQEDPTEFEQLLREEEAAAAAETDPVRRTALQRGNARARHLLDALPTLTLYLPDQTFHGRINFYGKERQATLIAPGPGHTSGDAYLLLPAERIVFTGDLCFFASPPYMGSCEPQAWLSRMNRLEQHAAATYVPGHGPLGTAADIARQRQYIVALEELVARGVEAGDSLEQIQEQPLPEGFADWASSLNRARANIEFLYKRRV